jgi:hypothetical protein
METASKASHAEQGGAETSMVERRELIHTWNSELGAAIGMGSVKMEVIPLPVGCTRCKKSQIENQFITVWHGDHWGKYHLKCVPPNIFHDLSRDSGDGCSGSPEVVPVGTVHRPPLGEK